MTPKKPRPKKLIGQTRKIKTGCGNLFLTVNEDADGPFEVFIRFGKGGGCSSTIGESIGRLVSISLRKGEGAEEIIKQLMGITCHQQLPAIGEDPAVFSCADGVAQLLRKHMAEREKEKAS
jgi:ribonucleoside-diphosphate reductase alpha chain